MDQSESNELHIVRDVLSASFPDRRLPFEPRGRLKAFAMSMTGGIKPGITLGESGEPYCFQCRDFRLADVHGDAVKHLQA